MKENRMRKLFSILCMILVFTLAIPSVTEAASVASWSWEYDNEDHIYKWYCVGKKGYFYYKGSSLYQHTSGKSKKIASWNGDKGNIEIAYGRGDWLYVQQSNVLYGYNLKTGTKKVVIRKYYPVGLNIEGCGPYVYSRAAPLDDAFNTAYVWKLSGGTAKKVGTLGKHVKNTYVVGKTVLIEEFPEDGLLGKMALYKCNPNGKGKKREFLLEVTQGRIYPEGHSDTSIEIYADDFAKRTSTHYSYDIKTGKLTVVNVNHF